MASNVKPTTKETTTKETRQIFTDLNSPYQNSRLFSFNIKSKRPIKVMPASLLQIGVLLPEMIIFLKESGMFIRDACSCSIFS